MHISQTANNPLSVCQIASLPISFAYSSETTAVNAIRAVSPICMNIIALMSLLLKKSPVRNLFGARSVLLSVGQLTLFVCKAQSADIGVFYPFWNNLSSTFLKILPLPPRQLPHQLARAYPPAPKQQLLLYYLLTIFIVDTNSLISSWHGAIMFSYSVLLRKFKEPQKNCQ